MKYYSGGTMEILWTKESGGFMHQPARCIGSPSNKVMFSQVTNFRMQNRNVQMFPDLFPFIFVYNSFSSWFFIYWFLFSLTRFCLVSPTPQMLPHVPPLPFQISQVCFPFYLILSLPLNTFALAMDKWSEPFISNWATLLGRSTQMANQAVIKVRGQDQKWPLSKRQNDSTHAELVIAKLQLQFELYDAEMSSRNGLCMMEKYSSSLGPPTRISAFIFYL